MVNSLVLLLLMINYHGLLKNYYPLRNQFDKKTLLKFYLYEFYYNDFKFEHTNNNIQDQLEV